MNDLRNVYREGASLVKRWKKQDRRVHSTLKFMVWGPLNLISGNRERGRAWGTKKSRLDVLFMGVIKSSSDFRHGILTQDFSVTNQVLHKIQLINSLPIWQHGSYIPLAMPTIPCLKFILICHLLTMTMNYEVITAPPSNGLYKQHIGHNARPCGLSMKFTTIFN